MRSGTVRSLVAAAIVATPLAAIAGQLTTPLMPAPDNAEYAVCFATNVGMGQAQVTITATNALGNTAVPLANTCGNPMDPGHSCSTIYSGGADVWCAFEVRGKVKAAIHLFRTGEGPVMTLPATR